MSAVRLTERQQLALALEESLKAAQPQPPHQQPPSSKGSGDSSFTKAPRPINTDQQLRRSSSEASAQRAPAAPHRPAALSLLPVRVPPHCSTGSDTESSAGASVSRDLPAFVHTRADAARSLPGSPRNAPASPRKRKRDSEDADVSSSSQSGGRILKCGVKSAGGLRDKDASCSDNSRHSHSTSLPSSPQVRKVAVFELVSMCPALLLLDAWLHGAQGSVCCRCVRVMHCPPALSAQEVLQALSCFAQCPAGVQ